MKTLQVCHPAMLTIGWHDLAIQGVSYAAKSSPRSKRYNAPTSMQAVIDSGGYLCVTVLTIKRRDLGD